MREKAGDRRRRSGWSALGEESEGTNEEEEEADIRKGEGTRIKEVKEAEDQKKIITKDIKDINNLIIPQYATSIQHNI